MFMPCRACAAGDDEEVAEAATLRADPLEEVDDTLVWLPEGRDAVAVAVEDESERE